MGCCTMRSVKTNNTIAGSATISKSLKSLICTREQLLTQLYDLHNLNLICNNELENCIIKHIKDQAVILKEKRAAIRIKLRELQTLIGKLDTCLESDPINIDEKKHLDDQAKKYLASVKNSSIFDRDMNLSTKNDKYLENLKKDLLSYHINEKQIEIEVEHDFQIQETQAKEGTFVRRKYKKSRSLT